MSTKPDECKTPGDHPGMKLLYITKDPKVAQIIERCGIDWVFVDLEINGKTERQEGRNAVISGHTVEDVRAVRQVLGTSQLMVRTNPWGKGSVREVDQIIDAGADIVMLPFFTSAVEVENFIAAVNRRAKVCLLLETPGAVENIDAILDLPGIDYIHVGLNDLHIAYRMRFMFEPLADGTVERLCEKFAKKNIEYGFGGMARIGKLLPPAENIIAEHYRLGSSMVILARSFYNSGSMTDYEDLEASFKAGVSEIRAWEQVLRTKPPEFYESNRRSVVDDVLKVAESMGR